MTRDLTRKQFAAALKRHGFRLELPALGYYKCGRVSISVLNAGLDATRRQQLAYLLQQKAEHAKRHNLDPETLEPAGG